jgi:DNA-binding MarR family transcriptional regulator
MTDSAKPFDLNTYVPCQLATVSHAIMRSVAGILEDRFGISVPEWKVLAIIADRPGLSAVTVARLAEMDTVAVSRAVTKLLDRGLIDRELDSEDRRRSVLNLSADGAALYDAVVPIASDVEARLLAEFSDDEKRVLEKAMRMLRAKSREFADSLTPPPARLSLRERLTQPAAQADRFRPQRPGPLVGGIARTTHSFG